MHHLPILKICLDVWSNYVRSSTWYLAVITMLGVVHSQLDRVELQTPCDLLAPYGMSVFRMGQGFGSCHLVIFATQDRPEKAGICHR